MKFKTSYFNNAIIFEDLKRLWGLAVLYFLLVFFTGPLQIMLRIGDKNSNVRFLVERFLTMRGMELQIIFSIAFCIILSMLIFRYLHTDKSSTVMHSFPITRKEMYHSHNISALILILAPVVVNTLILISLMIINNDGGKTFQEVYTMKNIWVWTGNTLLINISIYLVATLTAMISGITLIQGILSFILIFLPIGLGSLINLNLDQLLYGFVSRQSIFPMIGEKIVPLTAILANVKITLGLVIWYIALSIILYVSAYRFYKNRQLERASDPIAFDVLKPIFKYGVTFCAMVLGGAYFYSLKRVDIWLYIGYFIGGYLGYTLADMLLKKSIWVFKNIKGLIIYTMIIIIVFLGIKLDITGFERRIPHIENIENAYYGYGIYPYIYEHEEGLYEKDNIEAITKLHKEIIDNKKLFLRKENTPPNRAVGIAYTLKNGKTLYREYIVPNEFIENNSYAEDIYESIEYKLNHNKIFKLDISKIDYIEINPNAPVNRNVKIVDPSEIKEIVEIIKEDILEETYEESIKNNSSWASISIRYDEDIQPKEIENGVYMATKDDRVHMSWKSSYEKLTKWLKEKGYYEQARVMPDDIDYVIIEKIDKDMDKNEAYRIVDQRLQSNNEGRIEIRDKKVIAYLISNNINRGHFEETEYFVGFYLKNGNNYLRWFYESDLPEDIIN